MDPLSVSASIIAVLQGFDRLSDLFETYRTYQRAGDEVLALINDVSDLRLVLNEHHAIANRSESLESEAPSQALREALKRIGSKIVKIENLIRDDLITFDRSGQLVTRRLSWVRKKEKIEKSRREIRNLKEIASEYLAILTSRSHSRLGISIGHVSAVTVETSVQQQQLASEIDRRFDMQGKIISRVADGLDLLARKIEETHEMFNSELASQQSMLHDFMTAVHRMDQTSNSSSVNALRVNVRRFDKGGCNYKCSCSCHKVQKFQFGQDQALSRVLGNLFIGYSGLPIITPACNDEACQQAPALNVSYFFPRWFLQKAIFIAFSGGTRISASLQVVNVAYNKNFIQCLMRGDKLGAQNFLTNRIITPNTFDPTARSFPLPLALSYLQLDLCELLINAGADPYLGAEAFGTAVQHAGRLLKDSNLPAETRNRIQALIPCDDQYHDSLPELHRVVLGMTKLTVDQALASGTTSIDEVDQNGRTALQLAVRMNNCKMVEAILRHQSDPMARRTMAESIARIIGSTRCRTCLDTILATGVNIDACPHQNYYRLFWYACGPPSERKPDTAFLAYLIDRGAEITSHRGSIEFEIQPLMVCILSDYVDAARLLISVGADINTVDGDGDSTIFIAIWAPALKCLKLLLRMGADYTARNKANETILHCLASLGSMETMEIVADAHLEGLDVDAKGPNGTAREVLRQRPDFNPVLNEAFEACLASIRPLVEKSDVNLSRAPRLQYLENDGSDEEEVFLDTLQDMDQE